MPTIGVEHSRRKNKFLMMNYLAKNTKRSDLKNSIQVVLRPEGSDEVMDYLPESEMTNGSSNYENGAAQTRSFNQLLTLTDGMTKVKDSFEPCGTPKSNESNLLFESEKNIISYDNVPFASLDVSARNNCIDKSVSEVDYIKDGEQNSIKGLDDKKQSLLSSHSVDVSQNESREVAKHLTSGCLNSNSDFNISSMNHIPRKCYRMAAHRGKKMDLGKKSCGDCSTKHISREDITCGAESTSANMQETLSSNVSAYRNVGYEPRDVENVYDDEEYVEDLAQLDILLHYVNNLSASLEFLDWEKNKRISTDLVPTLLDIYDALYAKLADPASPAAEGSPSDTNGKKEESGAVISVSEVTGEEDFTVDTDQKRLPADEFRRINNRLENGKSTKLINCGKVMEEESLGRTLVDVRRPGVLSSDMIDCVTASDRITPPEELSCNNVSSYHYLSPSIGETTRLCDYCSNLSNDIPNCNIQRSVDKCQCRNYVPFLKSTENENSSVTRDSHFPSSTPSITVSSLITPMYHPNISHIPPRSPHDPRKLSSVNVNAQSNNQVYRPLSSISSSSSSSSNSLPRGQSGINTSYLASVESLVENDDDESERSSGTRQPGVGGATKRRERNLKVRRDFRGHLSRPGSCDSGVAQCHSISQSSAAPSQASLSPPEPSSTIASNHHAHSLATHAPHPTPLLAVSCHAPTLTNHVTDQPSNHAFVLTRSAHVQGTNSPSPAPLLRHRHAPQQLAHMDRLVLEVLDTEALYVQGLSEVIQGYLDPWLRGEDSGVTPLQATELFSNLREIHAFNGQFLRAMQHCGVDPVRLAQVFVRNNAGFAIYTHYCTQYPRTVSLLTELMQHEDSVSCFRERQLALGHTLPLGSYLLKPVQRILKYHLLLENILKHFDREKDPDGYTVVLNARNATTGMAHHINDMKRRHEHCVRVQEIQSLLLAWGGADLTTFGELAAEGTFRILSAKGLRHAFLFSKMLLICKKKDENFLVYKTHIMCSNLMLIESVPREPLCFQVIPFDNPRLQYTLQARNREHKHEWTQQLKRLILENYSAEIPPHARQLVMELGQAKQDECGGVGSGSHTGGGGGRRPPSLNTGPEYLQKRRRGRRASEQHVSSATPVTSRLRLRRRSKDSVESGRSRSVSRGRDTEDDDDAQRPPLIVTPDKPRLRLSMWRRKSEPNVPKNRNSLGCPSTPSTTAPTTPTTPTPLCSPSTTSCTPALTITPEATSTPAVAASPALRLPLTTTQDGTGLLAPPEVAVVASLPPDCHPCHRFSLSGQCSVALCFCATDGTPSVRPTIYIQVDDLSVSECERDDDRHDEAEDEEEDDDDDAEQTTQENLEEIVSHLLQHNLHLQQLLLSKQRRGLLARKKLRSATATATSYETSDTENDDLMSHDSGLPFTSVHSMNSINNMNSSSVSINNVNSSSRNSGVNDKLGSNDAASNFCGGDVSDSAMLDSITVSDAGLNIGDNSTVDYVNFNLSGKNLSRTKLNTSVFDVPEVNDRPSLAVVSEREQHKKDASNISEDRVSSLRDGGSSSEAPSVYSSAVSINNQQDCRVVSKLNNDRHSESSSHSISDFGIRRAAAYRRSHSNYDNLMNIFSSLRGKAGDKRSIDNMSIGSKENSKCLNSNGADDSKFVLEGQDVKKQSLWRVHSFNSEVSLAQSKDSVTRRGDAILSCRRSESGSPKSSKERPATIAVSSEVFEQSDNSSYTLNDSTVTETTVYEGEDHCTDCSEVVAGLYDVSGRGVHPEHKIYTKAILSKSSLRNVISKLTSTRKTLIQDQQVSDSQLSDLDKVTDKNSGKLVYSMARQCRKSLKERIKQIRSEEEISFLAFDAKNMSSSNSIGVGNNSKNASKAGSTSRSTRAMEQINSMPQYQQGSSSIGAKLASNADPVIYQVPHSPSKIASDCTPTSQDLKDKQDTDSPAEVTELDSDKGNDNSEFDALNLDESSGSLEEFEDDNSGGDSYYERSFEVIEDLLENDLFRDSAIYSDHEDPDACKMNAEELTKNFPRSILNRVSKSPSLRSDRFNHPGKNSLPTKYSGRNCSAAIENDTVQANDNHGLDVTVQANANHVLDDTVQANANHVLDDTVQANANHVLDDTVQANANHVLDDTVQANANHVLDDTVQANADHVLDDTVEANADHVLDVVLLEGDLRRAINVDATVNASIGNVSSLSVAVAGDAANRTLNDKIVSMSTCVRSHSSTPTRFSSLSSGASASCCSGTDNVEYCDNGTDNAECCDNGTDNAEYCDNKSYDVSKCASSVSNSCAEYPEDIYSTPCVSESASKKINIAANELDSVSRSPCLPGSIIIASSDAFNVTSALNCTSIIENVATIGTFKEENSVTTPKLSTITKGLQPYRVMPASCDLELISIEPDDLSSNYVANAEVPSCKVISIAVGCIDNTNNSSNNVSTDVCSNNSDTIRSSSSDVCNSNNIGLDASLSNSISPRNKNSIKKVPPPVPAKPDGVHSRTGRGCGSKILTQLKNLEKCSRFSKAGNSDSTLDGLKSLKERRKELDSWTHRGRLSTAHASNNCVPDDDNNISIVAAADSAGDHASDATCRQCGTDQACCCNKEAVEPKGVPSSSVIIMPPRSPLLSVRAFVCRNVPSMRASRVTTTTTVNKPRSLSSLQRSASTAPKEDISGGEDQPRLQRSLNHHQKKEDSDASPSPPAMRGISIARRKSIKSFGSYISKLNSRSSSVPPRLHQRHESRQSSLPTSALEPTSVKTLSTDGKSCCDSDDNEASLSKSDQKYYPTLESSSNSYMQISPVSKGTDSLSVLTENLSVNRSCRIKTSVSFPSSLHQSTSPSSSLPNTCSSLPVSPEPFEFLPAHAVAGGDGEEEEDEEDNSSGGVIEIKRPKGWVRHVVGRLQQGDRCERRSTDRNTPTKTT